MIGLYIENFGTRMKTFPKAKDKRVGKSWFACWKLYSYQGRKSSRREGPVLYFVETSKHRANRIARCALGNPQFFEWQVLPREPLAPLRELKQVGTVKVFNEANL